MVDIVDAICKHLFAESLIGRHEPCMIFSGTDPSGVRLVAISISPHSSRDRFSVQIPLPKACGCNLLPALMVKRSTALEQGDSYNLNVSGCFEEQSENMLLLVSF